MNEDASRPDAIRVRPATPADVPLILCLVRELAEYERALEQVVASEQSLERHLFGPRGGDGPALGALIGELDGRAEGFALYFYSFSTWLATAGIWLEDLYVRPAARRRGLGRALFMELARMAVRQGCGRLEWAVLNWNRPAIDFYRRMGAVPLEQWTTYRLSGEALQRLGRAGHPPPSPSA